MMEFLKAKKSLGQNFLTAPAIVRDIADASETVAGDTVLEVGPGTGVLTRELLDKGAHVIAIEKDDRLIPVLEKTFQKDILSRRLVLIHADILDCNLPNITPLEYRVVANIPYYITGQLIRRFLESDHQPVSMTLLLQKEVAERIVARDGKESLLSLGVKIFGEPRYVRTVGRGAFSPSPDVDSAVLHVSNISTERLGGVDKKFFFKILHLGFAHKRKQLLPNLAGFFKRKTLEDIFKDLEFGTNIRAEDMSLSDWVRLGHALKV